MRCGQMVNVYKQVLYWKRNVCVCAYVHRIIEWFGMEGTFKDRLVQIPCCRQGQLSLDQLAQSPI